MRSWAVPKGPSLDPAVKRLAVEVDDHALSHNDFEGALGEGGVIVWDRGSYEQGGRVPWPEALERGHAVFVLHGEKLRGGFALQRTRPRREAAVAADQAPRRATRARAPTWSPSSRGRCSAAAPWTSSSAADPARSGGERQPYPDLGAAAAAAGDLELAREHRDQAEAEPHARLVGPR